jgi:hypothetical protein
MLELLYSGSPGVTTWKITAFLRCSLKPSRNMQELLFNDIPGVVVHLWLPGQAADLDEALHVLALENLGTRFVRTPVQSAGKLLQLLRRPQGSWLVAGRRGGVVGILAATGNEAEEAGLHGGLLFRGVGATVGDDETSDFGSQEEATWVCS